MTPKTASRKNWKAWLVCALAVLVLPTAGMGSASATSRQAEPCTDIEDEECQGDLAVGDGYTVPYYSSYPLNGTNAATHAVIVLHGSGGRYDDSFEGIVAAAELEGGQTLENTLIVSPRFTNDEQDPDDGEAYWEAEAWEAGDGAIEPEGLAAFAVMDRLVKRLADKQRFPNLETATFMGFSAGGQFSGRWAAVSPVLDTLSGLTLRIVVTSPSTYLYLNRFRPDLEDPSGTTFIVPDVDCPYNSYKYGLEEMDEHAYAYLHDADPRQLRQRFVAQDVYYMIGEDDTGDDAEQDCEAMVQGEQRLERGTLFYNWLQHYHPRADHTMLTIPDVGHDDIAIYPSEQSRRSLFRGF